MGAGGVVPRTHSCGYCRNVGNIRYFCLRRTCTSTAVCYGTRQDESHACTNHDHTHVLCEVRLVRWPHTIFSNFADHATYVVPAYNAQSFEMSDFEDGDDPHTSRERLRERRERWPVCCIEYHK